MPVLPSEREDFENEIAKAGYDPSDFEIDPCEDPMPVGLAPQTGTVTVTRKSNGHQQTYRTGGSGTHWVVDFARDLAKGLFKGLFD